jgi:hypothetical protein
MLFEMQFIWLLTNLFVIVIFITIFISSQHDSVVTVIRLWDRQSKSLGSILERGKGVTF